MTRHSDDTVNHLDLELPILTAAHLAGVLEKIIATDILDDLGEGERQALMEIIAERLARETMAVHEMYHKIADRPSPPLEAVTSGDK